MSLPKPITVQEKLERISTLKESQKQKQKQNNLPMNKEPTQYSIKEMVRERGRK